MKRRQRLDGYFEALGEFGPMELLDLIEAGKRRLKETL